MKQRSLNDRLNLLRDEKIPLPPPNLVANILRAVRVRQAEAGVGQTFLGELLRTVLRPTYAAAAMGLAILSGAATTAVAMDLSTRAQTLSEPSVAADILDLQLLDHSDDVVVCCCRPSSSRGH